MFGSVARGEESDDSDIDLLVDLDEGVGLVTLIALGRELGDIFGREVDVVPAAGVKQEIQSVVLREAIPL